MQVQFDLHLLGWKAFEDLVACIFRDIVGQTLQVFAEGVDGGRDAAFHGIWRGDKPPLHGSFAIQCKHTSKAARSLTMAVVEEELEKVARLAKQGLADNYFLVTNLSLPAGMAEQAEQQIQAAGAKAARVFGAEWIADTIAENPRLRRLVPRLYGLGDLTQIVTHQAYRQAREVLDSIAPDLSCFVPTDAYRRSAHALQEHGFVLLLGEPASGKTMIANLLALSAADEWDLQTLMITGPADFSRLWNPDDPGQFLWVDDAFGATQCDANRVSEWNHLLPKLKAAVRAGARIVFTSRDYIFAAAKRNLKVRAFELFEDSRVIIEVERLTPIERQMILYSHLKTGAQPLSFKSKVKPYLQKAVAVNKFLPEIARRFANPKFTGQMRTTEQEVVAFFDKPHQVLLDIVSSLAPPESAAIALVFISGGRLPVPITVDTQVSSTLELLGVTVGEVKSAFAQLDDSLLRRVKDQDREYWAFRHPTIRDAYATLVGGNPELIDVYLAGVSTEQMLSEVTCGISVEGAKITVPPERYGTVIDKLKAFEAKPTWWSDPVQAFLGSRCRSDLVLKYYENADIRDCLPRGIWNLWVPDDGLQILVKLRRDGLLQEEIRLEAVEKILGICDADHSCRFVEAVGVRDLLTDEEADSALRKVADDVIANGMTILDELAAAWDRESDPESLFAELDKTLEFIQTDVRFEDVDKVRAAALAQTLKQRVEYLRSKIQEKNYEKLETEDAPADAPAIGRNIFDDVDE